MRFLPRTELESMKPKANEIAKNRRAPPIAAVNAARAEQNIVKKCTLIENYLAQKPKLNESGQVDGYPRSVRQFNQWAPSVNEFGEGLPNESLSRNSNETLNRLPRLLTRVKAALASAGAFEAQIRRNAKDSRIGSLKERLKLSESLREIAERELANAIEQVEILQGKLRKQDAVLSGHQRKAQEMIEDLSRQLEVERGRNASLTKTLAKTTRLVRDSHAS